MAYIARPRTPALRALSSAQLSSVPPAIRGQIHEAWHEGLAVRAALALGMARLEPSTVEQWLFDSDEPEAALAVRGRGLARPGLGASARSRPVRAPGGCGPRQPLPRAGAPARGRAAGAGEGGARREPRCRALGSARSKSWPRSARARTCRSSSRCCAIPTPRCAPTPRRQRPRYEAIGAAPSGARRLRHAASSPASACSA